MARKKNQTATPAAEDKKVAKTKATATPEAAPASPATAKTAPAAKPKKDRLSALDAAAKVLADGGEPMSCPDLIEAMTKKGLWSSPNGQTPAATLYSAILREMKVKGDDARFVKTERGKFKFKA